MHCILCLSAHNENDYSGCCSLECYLEYHRQIQVGRGPILYPKAYDRYVTHKLWDIAPRLNWHWDEEHELDLRYEYLIWKEP